MKMFQTEGDKLYQPAFAEILKSAPTRDNDEQALKRKLPKPKPLPKNEAAGAGGANPTAKDEKEELLKKIARLSQGKKPTTAASAKFDDLGGDDEDGCDEAAE